MKTPNISLYLPLCLSLWTAGLGWSTAALASLDPGAGISVIDIDVETTVVSDQALLECRASDANGTLVIDLKVDGEWTPTDNDILDQIAADSGILAVTSRFQPVPGDEHRMRFRVQGSSTWSGWSSWTTSRIAHVTPVPGAGETDVDEFEAETRRAGGLSTIATHGYIKIKKLNSGG